MGASGGGSSAWRMASPPAFRPGPKKVVPLTLEELRGEVARLHHGQASAAGASGRCIGSTTTQISRRDLDGAHGDGAAGARPAAPGRMPPHHLAGARPGLGAGRRGAGESALPPPAPASGAGSRLALQVPPLGGRADLGRNCGRAPGTALRAAWRRRSCSSATTGPISTSTRSMWCWPGTWSSR